MVETYFLKKIHIYDCVGVMMMMKVVVVVVVVCVCVCVHVEVRGPFCGFGSFHLYVAGIELSGCEAFKASTFTH